MLDMETYYFKSNGPAPKITCDWANHVLTSKYAEARAARAKHRYRKRRK